MEPRGLLSLLVAPIFVAPAFGAANPTKAEAERLVAAAVQAEVAGDIVGSFKLLHDALRLDPENRVARAQLGEVKLDGKWTTAEEAQRRAAADPLQIEYCERRKVADKSVQDQLILARWCKKHNLDPEGQVHWSNVLSIEPKNEEALRALDLKWQKGRLVSRSHKVSDKEQPHEAKRVAERWASKLVKWRRAATGRDMAARLTALQEIRSVDDSQAIPSLEDVTLGRDANDGRHTEECAAIGRAFVAALGRMQGQAATESLARHAVFAPDETVRSAATKLLKPREQHDYVPMLLAGLGMPIESSFSLTTGPDGSVHYLRSFYREGQEADWSWDSRRQAVQHDLGGRQVSYDVYTGEWRADLPAESSVVVKSKKHAIAAKYQSSYSDDAARTEQKVENANQAIKTLNGRIVPVLVSTTGRDYGDNPKAWWDWWREQNEYYTYEQPVSQGYDTETDHYTYGHPTASVVSSAPQPPPPPRHCSCFAKGTLVWTKRGSRPIESIEPGDLILSQNVDTGELKYEPVLLRTVRPPSQLVKISLDGEELHSTPGHPFWVAGAGWRMAKELKAGEVIHSVSRPARVRSVTQAETGEAYNLVVADFSTYFVGENGMLAHDITVQRPTQASVPGFIKPRAPANEVAAKP